MKAIVVLLLVLSLLIVGGCAESPAGDDAEPQEVTEAEAMEEVDESFVSEDEEIEIGEMI